MSLDLPGFAAPVTDAQRCFRAVLDALARPGTRHAAGAGLCPPAPLAPAAAALLLTLADADVAVHLAGALDAAAEWVAFHCGVQPCADPVQADFVVTRALPDLAALGAGTDEAPEQGATVILQLDALDGGPGWTLSGPGLRMPSRVNFPLPSGFERAWAANGALFPRGVDLILCAGTELAALPRTVRVAA